MHLTTFFVHLHEPTYSSCIESVVDRSANIWYLVFGIHLFMCIWHYLYNNRRLTIHDFDMIHRQYLARILSRHISNYMLFNIMYPMHHISHDFITLNLIFNTFILSLSPIHSPNIHLQFHQYGTYAQQGLELQLTEDLRCTPWESTHTCIQENIKSSLSIQWLTVISSFVDCVWDGKCPRLW